MVYIGIDVGGTGIKIGVVDEQGQLIHQGETPTLVGRPYQEIIADMGRCALKVLDEAKLTVDDVHSVGIGIPGIADAKTGNVIFCTNMGWKDVPLRSELQKYINKPVFIDNDATVAGFAESVAGVSKGTSSSVFLTLGTGVGGGIIIDGKIQSGFNYKGAELGHIGMVYQGVPCTCGRRGCIESYCAVTGLIRITRESMQLNAKSKMWELAEGSLDKVSGRTAFDAMRAGDEAGKAVVDQYIDYLAYAVSGIINLFQPQAVVIGGGISKEGETLFGPMRERAYPQTFNHDPNNCSQIIKAKLGNDAGIIGAALLGKQYK